MHGLYQSLLNRLSGKTQSPSRKTFCSSLTRRIMPYAVVPNVKSTYYLADNIDKVEEMLDDIKKEFTELVDELAWMDDETKEINVVKALAITGFVGYQDGLLDPSTVAKFYDGLTTSPFNFFKNIVNHKQWQMRYILRILTDGDDAVDVLHEVENPLQVNAFYSREKNSIYIPAGILQKPFYYRGLECLNYGAIGTILGHELTHGFDIDGKNFDVHGQRQEDLWSEEITHQYVRRAQCFVQQYGRFNLTKTKRLDGSHTLAENIADNGGLREAYQAYQTYTKRHGREQKLAGFEHFSHQQLFFLSYANIWCEATTDQFKELASRDSHSPNRIRILATLQNMKEFSDAFSCPRGSFMNPQEKCIIW